MSCHFFIDSMNVAAAVVSARVRSDRKTVPRGGGDAWSRMTCGSLHRAAQSHTLKCACLDSYDRTMTSRSFRALYARFDRQNLRVYARNFGMYIIVYVQFKRNSLYEYLVRFCCTLRISKQYLMHKFFTFHRLVLVTLRMEIVTKFARNFV